MARDDVADDTGAALAASIRREIDAAGGWIPFSRFMDLALYAPALGYYSAGATKLGRDPRDGSDFTTAPELTPLFGRAFARPVAAVLGAPGDTIVELGGGTGKLAADLLAELEELDSLPSAYLLLDVSADLRERQRGTIARRVPHLLPRVRWISALPPRIDGAVVANEVLDALPVELVESDGLRWLLLGVERDGDAFRFAGRPLPAGRAMPEAMRAATFAPGYRTERHPVAEGLVASVVERLGPDAVAFFVDYGFPAHEYYHPQRATGTLMTHRGHRAGIDPLADVGLQDITAHVDFTAMAKAAAGAGGVVAGFASQSAFLIDCGIADLLQGDAADTAAWARQASALQTLLSEAEMGELFKVLAVARRPWSLPGFRRQDRSAVLDD